MEVAQAVSAALPTCLPHASRFWGGSCWVGRSPPLFFLSYLGQLTQRDGRVPWGYHPARGDNTSLGLGRYITAGEPGKSSHLDFSQPDSPASLLTSQRNGKGWPSRELHLYLEIQLLQPQFSRARRGHGSPLPCSHCPVP